MTVPSASPRDVECLTAVRRLWDHLDRTLDAPAAEEVERHLATCEACSSHFAFARLVLEALAAAAPALPAPHEVDALRGRVLDALENEGFRRRA